MDAAGSRRRMGGRGRRAERVHATTCAMRSTQLHYSAIIDVPPRSIPGQHMSQLNLSIATTDYDHFRDFRLGVVKAEGIELNWLNLGHHECFARFTANREFHLSELSFAKFSTQVTRVDSDIVGLPVICSRLFRFSSFYVNRKSGIRTVQDLAGKKVGSPEWAHSAAVYMRGWMHNDMGVRLSDVHWYQAGANSPGRVEKVE